MVPFIGESYTHESYNVSSQRTLNLYPEIIKDNEAKAKIILIGTPGSKLHTDMSDTISGNCRGLTTTSARQTGVTGLTRITRTFGVYGTSLVEFISEGVYNIVATVSGGSSDFSFADTGKYLMMVDGEKMWSFEYDTDTFAEVSGLPFTNARKIVYLNNRVVCINEDPTIDITRNYNKFYWSDLNKPLIWDGLSWATAEGTGDSISAIEMRQGQLWLFGAQSYEVWQGTSNPDLPYSRVGGSFGDIGCGAIYSTSAIEEQIFWLGSSTAGKNIIYMSNGYNAKRISTHAIETALNKDAGSTTDAVGWTYQMSGHTFYVLSLITQDKTWVFDVATGQWHERSTRDPNLDEEHKWAPVYATFGLDQVLVGYGNGPQLLTLDLNYYEDYDNIKGTIPIVRLRQSPIYWENLIQMFHAEFQIDIETGVGLTPIEQGHNPRIMLQFSDDSGHTWSNESWTDLGKVGEYKARARWRRLGRSRERVYRVKVSDPVKVVMIGAKVIAQSGTAP